MLIDGHGDVIHHIFTRTEGRPIQVVTRILRELEEAVGWAVRVVGVGTTGSGRELIGELVGADSINDEITAHKTGATFIGDRLLGKRPDTIFEIGGQDSKYISLEAEGGTSTETIVVDFTMNEACAAGTGSFLEERAAELGVSIKDEFAELALSSKAPIRLGERCTVFMERDVNTYMQRGANRADVIAGLAYSIAYNYINRVVRGGPSASASFSRVAPPITTPLRLRSASSRARRSSYRRTMRCWVRSARRCWQRRRSLAPARQRAFGASSWAKLSTRCANSPAAAAAINVQYRSLT